MTVAAEEGGGGGGRGIGLFLNTQKHKRLRNRVLSQALCTRCGEPILTTRPTYPNLCCTNCQYEYIKKEREEEE